MRFLNDKIHHKSKIKFFDGLLLLKNKMFIFVKSTQHDEINHIFKS